MNQTPFPLSAQEKQLRIENMTKYELISEVARIQELYNDLLNEWEEGFECQRIFTRGMLKALSVMGAGSLDPVLEGKKMTALFDKLFCKLDD